MPDNYFDEFEMRLMNRIELENFPKKSGFTIPQNYFNTAEAEICNRTQTIRPKVISLPKLIAISASIAAVVVGFLILNPIKSVEESNTMISIQEYIDSDFMKFNFYELDVIDYQTISTDDIQFDFLNEDEVEHLYGRNKSHLLHDCRKLIIWNNEILYLFIYFLAHCFARTSATTYNV